MAGNETDSVRWYTIQIGLCRKTRPNADKDTETALWDYLRRGENMKQDLLAKVLFMGIWANVRRLGLCIEVENKFTEMIRSFAVCIDFVA